MKSFCEQNKRHVECLTQVLSTLATLFQPEDYERPDDFEGRLLFALVCHAKISEEKSRKLRSKFFSIHFCLFLPVVRIKSGRFFEMRQGRYPLKFALK